MEERRTEVVAELDQGNLKGRERVGGREGSSSDAHNNFAYIHLFYKAMY